MAALSISSVPQFDLVSTTTVEIFIPFSSLLQITFIRHIAVAYNNKGLCDEVTRISSEAGHIMVLGVRLCLNVTQK